MTELIRAGGNRWAPEGDQETMVWTWRGPVLRAGMVMTGLLLVVGACGSTAARLTTESVTHTGVPDYSFVIPAGTGELLDRGETVELLPAEIDAQVGEVIEIVNLDDRGHLLGPFYVGANETMTQRFSSAGTFVGSCAVHPSGELTVVVTDAPS